MSRKIEFWGQPGQTHHPPPRVLLEADEGVQAQRKRGEVKAVFEMLD